MRRGRCLSQHPISNLSIYLERQRRSDTALLAHRISILTALDLLGTIEQLNPSTVLPRNGSWIWAALETLEPAGMAQETWHRTNQRLDSCDSSNKPVSIDASEYFIPPSSQIW